MNINLKNNSGNVLEKYKNVCICFLAVAMFLCSSDALAVGGLNKATSVVKDIQQWVYGIVGLICGINLLIVGVQCKIGDKRWSDFIKAVPQTIAVGASVVIATWAFGLYAS